MSNNIDFKVHVSCYTYNHAPYIVDAMKGFTIQKTSFPYLCIIVDDASTDGEPGVIRQYMEQHFDLVDSAVVRNEENDDYQLLFAQHKENRNCYFAVYFLKYNHYSIKKSKIPYLKEWDGIKYIAICEGDDYWIAQEKLQKQVDFMEANPSVSFVHTDCNVLYQEKGDVILACNAPLIDYYNETDVKRIIENILLAKCKVRTPTVLYRSESYKVFVSRNEFAYVSGYFLMGDIQLWIGLLQQGGCAYLPEATAVYRVSDGTASRPKKYYSNIRFKLSSKELRIYYNQKYGYLHNEIDDIIKGYKHLLRIYREHDSSFKGILEIEKLYDNKLEHCVFKIKNMLYRVRYNLSNYYRMIRKI